MKYTTLEGLFSDTIKQHGLTSQRDLALWLSRPLKSHQAVTNTDISNWQSGVYKPSINKVLSRIEYLTLTKSDHASLKFWRSVLSILDIAALNEHPAKSEKVTV